MYGCEGSILQLLKLPDGTVKVLVEGIRRVKILDFKDNEKFIICDFNPYNDIINDGEDLYPLAVTAIRRMEEALETMRTYYQDEDWSEQEQELKRVNEI